MKMPSEELCGELKEKVYKRLKGMRYVIVMDDVWSTKVWDDLRMIFPEDHNGSRIILTTRLSDVAAYPDSYSPLHKMRLMDEEQSWNLLRQKVFTHHDCPSELENIGKEIAESCRGLPLAIVVIVGVLTAVSNTVASWTKITENVNSAVGSKDGHFEKILSLSYTHLPHHLRACFLYMGGFPEDYEIRVSKLVKLWVAEGFLGRSLSEISEKVAEEYLEDLVKRSLILVGKRKCNGKIKTCSVHDLVRDLCIRKAHEEKFLLHAEKILGESMENQRRVSVTHFRTDCLANIHNSRIRTIKCFQCGGIEAKSLGNYKLLRVLVGIYTSFTKPYWESISFADQVADQVSELFLLKYLDLLDDNLGLHDYNLGRYVYRLPAAISNLQYLQTLIIHTGTYWHYPHRIIYLPREIWRMPQLRHLISSFFGPLPSPQKETYALENLQTLSLLVNFECNKRILEKIPNLKKLGLFYHNSGDSADFHLENLVYLRHLEKLRIKMYEDFRSRQYLKPVFPTSLKKLTLSGCRFPWEAMGVVGSLPILEVLKLRDFAFKGRTWETNEGEFHELKLLLIDKSDLKHWITEKSHFPRLKCLVIHHCRRLKGIPNDIGVIPTLELIEVDKVNKSLVESARLIQEEQEDFGNALQLRLVDDKQFSYFDSFEQVRD